MISVGTYSSLLLALLISSLSCAALFGLGIANRASIRSRAVGLALSIILISDSDRLRSLARLLIRSICLGEPGIVWLLSFTGELVPLIGIPSSFSIRALAAGSPM